MTPQRQRQLDDAFAARLRAAANLAPLTPADAARVTVAVRRIKRAKPYGTCK